MKALLEKIWSGDRGQDIADYAVMVAVILVVVVGTAHMAGRHAHRASRLRVLSGNGS